MDQEKFYTARGYQMLDKDKNNLSPSLEDYLEMIVRAIKKHGSIRVNELAAVLNVKPSSVSKTLVKLSRLGFIDYKKYGVIRLTDKGKKTGEYLLQRHDIIKNFFELISHDSPNIFVETELVEHMVSKATVKNIERLINFFSDNPQIYSKFRNYESQK